ncbi:hypothetical protein AB6A40_008249 [Gnathostoma spinigerum]|uniref:G-protein coupled receptors family 1 profile domain-containing protein n=1 Tax=Gnathostoma spinigerum TaxID=75299 RepID=A0ABD6EZ35_9BILA
MVLPLRYLTWFSRRNTIIIIAISWLIPFILSILCTVDGCSLHYDSSSYNFAPIGGIACSNHHSFVIQVISAETIAVLLLLTNIKLILFLRKRMRQTGPNNTSLTNRQKKENRFVMQAKLCLCIIKSTAMPPV